MIPVDHAVSLLSILVAGQDIEYDSAWCWVHGEFKFETVLPLVSLLFRDLQIGPRIHMLELQGTSIDDDFPLTGLLNTLIVLLLLIHTSLEHLQIAGSHFSFLGTIALKP